jgi:very-short-patch-repair endonuclease
MGEQGYRIVRVIARDVMRDLDAVVRLIVEQVTNPLHHRLDGPPPRAGEDL